MNADSHTPTDADTTSGVVTINIDKSASDMRDVLLRVGPGGSRRQRFVGRKLGEAREFTKSGIQVVRVYLSRKGKYVVHRQQSDWMDFAQTNWTRDLKNWREIFDVDDQTWGDYTVDILDSVEELAERVPARIYRELVDTETSPKIDELDI
ncbi:EXLDI protein [Nocardia sp. NPDC052112]|uniref:EXLDI protein n=1 Tax=Nocardia sp. NPDC052112 TaxID=3155646 RepID=UPI003420EFDF